MRKRSAQVFVLALVLASLGCDDASPDPQGDAGASSGGGKVTCQADPRVTAFTTGIRARSTSGKLTAEILDAQPSPPRRGAGDGGVNTWTMKFAVDGSPVPPETKIVVSTLMPDHGHGSPFVPTVTANADGTYAVTGIYLFMAGVWEISFSIDRQDAATFAFCVE